MLYSAPMSSADWFLIARWIGYVAIFAIITLRVLRTPKPPRP